MVRDHCTHDWHQPNFCDGQPLGLAAYFHIARPLSKNEQDAPILAYLQSLGLDAVSDNTPVWVPCVDTVCARYVLHTMTPLFAKELRVQMPDESVVDIDPEDANRRNVYVLKKSLLSQDVSGLIGELHKMRQGWIDEIDRAIMYLEEGFHAAVFGGVLFRGYEFKTMLGGQGAAGQIRRGFQYALDDLGRRIQE